MRFLTYNEIVAFHRKLIMRFGGLNGIRDKGLLESATQHPKIAYVIGREKDIHMLAAFYGYHLIKNHAFLDGNKRIGSFSMIFFLKLNNFEILFTNKELVTLATQIASSTITEKQVQIILKKKSRKLNAPGRL